MAQTIPIKLHVGNALKLMGQLYRSPADALKEYVSNAVDRWRELRALGRGPKICKVDIDVKKTSVTITCNTAGMSELEFRTALGRVADSQKKSNEVAQIGRLGIGLWGFMQVGAACTVFSRDDVGRDTLRVRLRDGRDHGEFDRAPRQESLDAPGFRVLISGLRFDPTRARGPLAPDKLQRLLAEKFEKYLRDGALRIDVLYPRVAPVHVRAPEITLPRIGGSYRNWWLPGKRPREIQIELYFDPSAKGKLAIRHAGVVVVEDLKTVNAYGLEESALTGGFVCGTVDADFLSPLPARTMFEENDDWFDLVGELDRLRPAIEVEVDILRREDADRRSSEVHHKALEIARDILDLPDFRDLSLPGGLARKRIQPARASGEGTPARPEDDSEPQTGPLDPPAEPGDSPDPKGSRIDLVETPFADGERAHSRFIGGVVQVNTLNPDYAREMCGTDESKIAYATLLIGKEVLAFNGGEETADALERYISFVFQMKGRTRADGVRVGKRVAKKKTRPGAGGTGAGE